MSASDAVPEAMLKKPDVGPSKLSTHSKPAKCPTVKTNIQSGTAKRRSVRLSSQRNETQSSPSMKKPRLSRQPTKSRSKNSSNIDIYMPDCLSPVLPSKEIAKVDKSRKLSPKSVLCRLHDDDVLKTGKVSPTVTLTKPPKAGSSLLSKPLLLRSKPSTEGFKMPKRNC